MSGSSTYILAVVIAVTVNVRDIVLRVPRAHQSSAVAVRTNLGRHHGPRRSAVAALAIRIRGPRGCRAGSRHSRVRLRLQEGRTAAVRAAVRGLRRGPKTRQEAWQDSREG